MFLYFLCCLKIESNMNKTLKTIFIYFVLILLLSLNHSSNYANSDITNSSLSEASKISGSEKNNFDGVKIGDIIEFGKFYDIVDEEIVKVPIKWQVLEQLNDFSLLISKDILKTMPYNYSWSPTNWEVSNIRVWLNYDFYDIAFNYGEKELIQKVTTANTGNPAYKVKKEFLTKDYVFLLSIEEAKKYYNTSRDLMAKGTEYAKKEGLWISKYQTSDGYSVWWLRSPGKTWSSAAIIHAAGDIGLGGDGVATRGNGIRPCIWIYTGKE